MDRLCNLALSLNRHEPLAAVARYGDVLRCAENVPAIAVANPAQLLLALLVSGFLHRQRLVEYEPARANEAARIALLVAVGL